MTQIKIDPARCSGHGRCYNLYPDLFESDDYGHGQVISGGMGGNILEDQAWAAVRTCPEDAVSFEP